tara:strand:- start:201 stop:770 length:570 start_codon:yes stop_codon:yes gene_type:complete
MEPFEAYQKYLALKLHFDSESYDYFKYRGKTNAKRDKFDVRQDRYFFHRLSKKDDLELYLASNLFENADLWVGQLLDQECIDRFKETKKRQQSLKYLFENDMSQFDSLDEALVVKNGDYPKVLNMYNRKQIMPETMVILNATCRVFWYWKENISDTIIWPKTMTKLLKYQPFVKFDVEDYVELVQGLYK